MPVARGPDGARIGGTRTFTAAPPIAASQFWISRIVLRSPMISNDGRFAVVFNGEIYKYPDVRAQVGRKEPDSGRAPIQTFRQASICGKRRWTFRFGSQVKVLLGVACFRVILNPRYSGASPFGSVPGPFTLASAVTSSQKMPARQCNEWRNKLLYPGSND